MGLKLLGIDFETNGPEPKTCDITEAAWALYDSDYGTMPIMSKVFLNKDVDQMDPTAEKITGISIERCQQYGIPRADIAVELDRDIGYHEPDFLVAHNAYGFDKIIFDRLSDFKDLNWIDTLEDLPEATYEKLGTRTLEFMAARSGFLNPFPHAALPDVYTMMKILMSHDLEEVALRSKIPSVIIAADVSFEKKDLAKERGFFWQQIRGGKVYTKKWVKKVKKDQVDAIAEEAPFGVAIID